MAGLEHNLIRRARLRLAGLSLLVMGSILYAAGFSMGRLLLQAQEQALQSELVNLAGTLHDSLKPVLPPPSAGPASLATVLPGLCLADRPCPAPTTLIERHALGVTDPERFQLQILNGEGEVVATSPPSREPTPGSLMLTTSVVLHRSHGDQEQDWGSLRLSRSLAGLEAEAQRLWWLGHGVFVLALVVIALASWWLAGLAMAPLIEAYQRQEQFSADVAHELRTPLANLLAVAEAQRAQPGIERVLAQGQRLQQLIADLLLLASLERPGAKTPMQRCDLAEITADVVEDWSEIAVASEQTLSMALEAETTTLRGNERELSRLLINLISNALQHSPCGGTVEVRLETQGRWLALSVRDQGPGISLEDQQRIFERFTRLQPDRSRQNGGSGLGLAIAQAIANRHGGEIRVASEPGHGATFTALLPAIG
ncbi:Two-component system sensor histidine kinase [Synechococcus sp. WH 8101]|jgi:two-component Ni(II)/redox sensor kinase NrsS|uniref:sensor histidine kinase n=1 Tax=unclassified Synechococcus TaxID=2626047 RepID=UPI001023A5C6|nr:MULTISPECIES: ATP-binding protein [unclassified Synechococcus]QBE68588.1 Two-component system sensor histidine kinase [Synechococcus sp. WH 8101]QNI44807.1 signal transduction histidine kinase [Synechococcus sp. WH 8101]QVV67932.1 two-component sensor histidine kinase [Synechococcus sp. LA31]